MIRIIKNAGQVWRGYRRFCRDGKTTERAYQSMVGLFTQTNGWHNSCDRSENKEYISSSGSKFPKLPVY